MSKNIVVISSSFRRNGNSQTLLNHFAKGLEENHHQITKIELSKLDLKFCHGCLTCQTKHQCVLSDDMNSLYQVIKNADILVFATPIYYYAVSGQLKTFLDRLNPLYGTKCKFKEVYLLATCADDNPKALDGAIKDISGWIECFEGVTLKKVLYGTGVTDIGDIENKSILHEAYTVAKEIL